MTDDQLPIAQDEGVQNSTKKPRKSRKKAISKAVNVQRRGNRLPSELLNGPIYEFSERYRGMLKALPKVKTSHKPMYNSIFSRKFMILVYLAGVERSQGYFSVYSLQEHFRQSDSGYADHYFSRLITDSWITAIDTHMVKHKHAVLSPLFHGLMHAITNTLRREYPDRYKDQALDISPEVQAIAADQSCFDIVQDIPDLRE